MPDQELSHRLQKAVLWVRAGADRYGVPTLGSPVELDVRWQDTRKEVVDPLRGPISVDAQVHTDRDVPVGSAMWKGALADLPGTSLVPETDVMYVVSSDGVPDVKARVYHWSVTLTRDRDRALPS